CGILPFTKIRSRFIRVEKIHSDFYTEYKDNEINPYLYEVHVCPQCGYSSTDQFSNRFPEGTQERIVEQFSRLWHSRDYGNIRTVDEAITTYKLALLCGELKEEACIVMAGIAIRLAWMYRLSKNEEQEQRFLKIALKYYKDSFENSDFLDKQMTEIRLLYLIGELNHRMGNKAEAVQFFSRVIQHRMKDVEKRVVEMAREQWQSIRHNKDENKD
ncbi:MAG TPA: DUF2225 domain-containing protein, partial [Bacilli bacterium]|nr:DUF2225 domain-containing protein [Bacilli bacterium]